MDFEHKVGIGGRLVGIGKRRLDGTEEFTWLDEPVHNTIVGSGFDQLFKFCSYYDNDDYGGGYRIGSSRCTFTGHTVTNDSNYNQQYSRDGALAYCRIGKDGTGTTSSMTNLVSPCSDYSSTTEGGVPWTYAYKGPQGNGDYRIRVTHRVTATSAGNVREIAWYGRSGQVPSRYANWEYAYNMFSRIVLPVPYEIGSGEQMIVSYELTIRYADLVPTAVDMGISAADGTPLKALKQFESNITESTTYDIPNIARSRFGLLVCDAYDLPGMSAHYSVLHQAINRVTYSTADRGFVSDRNVSYGSQLTKPTVAPIVTKGAMVSGSGSRNITFTVAGVWPNLSGSSSSIDIHMLNIDGYTYRFGYYDNSDPDNPVWVPQAWRKKSEDVWQITEVVSYAQI